MSQKIYKTAIYARLSREDADRIKGNSVESNSIQSQKAICLACIDSHEDLELSGAYIDEGFSGSDFDRPSFQKMMADVRAGEIDCIVVKDLSRFGRNYLDVGEYIEVVFPFLDVRFIAVNDDYDSLYTNASSDELIIPFKNLINEAYCRDISVKIRSQLKAKRKRGDFVGSFAVYGYLKDPKNKNRLVVDEFAAEVVRDIFRWKIAGASAGDIAERLNRKGILAPMDYKRSLGLDFFTPFCKDAHSGWNAMTVLRILKNPVYAGVLEQGKNTTPSYKVKRRIVKPYEEWDIAEGAHEALIDRDDFETVQRVLALDTRTSPGNAKVELFSGMVFCGECGAAMVRKSVPSGKKKYIYYICAAHKNEKTCSGHSLGARVLEETVQESLIKQIQAMLGREKLLGLAEGATLQKSSVKKQQERLGKKQEEISRYQRLLDSLYGNLVESVISHEEYQKLKKNYQMLLGRAKQQAEEIRTEMGHEIEEGMGGMGWMEQLKESGGVARLDRAIVVSMIERILVYRDRRVEILFNWQDGWA